MGRGRPRGNSTQRAIGRAVSKGLKGKDFKVKETKGIGYIIIWIILTILFSISGELNFLDTLITSFYLGMLTGIAYFIINFEAILNKL